METQHSIHIADSRNLSMISDSSIDLVVTSPPYPMIAMWDDLFTQMSPKIGKQLDEKNGDRAFELMHQELDKVWKELRRVTKKNSFVCINIGDAARTIDNRFQLYSNHSRIVTETGDTGQTNYFKVGTRPEEYFKR